MVLKREMKYFGNYDIEDKNLFTAKENDCESKRMYLLYLCMCVGVVLNEGECLI